jgi:hypothetical protein
MEDPQEFIDVKPILINPDVGFGFRRNFIGDCSREADYRYGREPPPHH